jgi:hypothetical protein
MQVRIQTMPTVKVPEDLGAQVDASAAEGWELERCIPIMAKGMIGGSYTDSLLLFFRRERR